MVKVTIHFGSDKLDNCDRMVVMVSDDWISGVKTPDMYAVIMKEVVRRVCRFEHEMDESMKMIDDDSETYPVDILRVEFEKLPNKVVDIAKAVEEAKNKWESGR